MFERFTDRAQRVVVLAQEEARMLNHDHLGTEHLLLGIVHEGEGVATRVLESLEIGLAAVRQQTEAMIGRGEQAPPGNIPFTPRAKKALELALRESKLLGHDYIGTEHILLGLVREGEGVAARVLAGLGADLNRVRQQVIQLLHGWAGEGGAGPGRLAVRLGRARPAGDLTSRVDSTDLRLAAVERWVGMRPDPRDLDDEIAQLRREKEAAIDAQDFEAAAALRNRERELLAGKASRAEQRAEGPSLAEEVSRLSAELERLRAILRDHGIESGDDVA